MSKRFRKIFKLSKRTDNPTSHSSGQGTPDRRSSDQPTTDPRTSGQYTPNQQRITDPYGGQLIPHATSGGHPGPYSSIQPTPELRSGRRTPDPRSSDQGGQRALDPVLSGQSNPTSRSSRQPSLNPNFGDQPTLGPSSNDEPTPNQRRIGTERTLESTSGRHSAPGSSDQPIKNGIYTITNEYHHRFIYLEDPNGTTPLKGHFRQGSRNAQWHVRNYGNDQYSIQNVEHNRYANSGNLAVVKAHVEGSSEERLWCIQALPTGAYTIATTDTRNLWMLPYDNPATPVELFNVHTDRRCWWTFKSADSVNENPTTQAVLFETKLPLVPYGGQHIPEGAVVGFSSVIAEATDLLQPLKAACGVLKVMIQRAEGIDHISEERRAFMNVLEIHLDTVENDIAKLEEDKEPDGAIPTLDQDAREAFKTYARGLKDIYELLLENQPNDSSLVKKLSSVDHNERVITGITRKIDTTGLRPFAPSKVVQMRQQLAQFRQELTAEESDALKRLKPVEAANYDEDRSCMEGTRTTILDNIATWACPLDGETQSNSSVYWLYSTPGLGKTSVANSLCDRLRRTHNLGGCFFCKHDNADLHEPKQVLPTLIAKLAQMWSPFRNLIAQILLDDPQINPESTRGELLLKPLQLLKKHPPRQLVLVIDALDECGQPNARGPLLDCLIKACSLVHWLKVVITSRPEADIKSIFDGYRINSRDLAEDDLKGDDIRLFTERRMASVARRRHLSSDWPSAERVGQIIERSRGLFIFVETLSRLVDVPKPEPLLVQVLNGKLEEANAELHKLYSTVITSRAVGHIEELQSMLRAVIAISAYRPLCADTLAKLIDIEVPTILSWLDELSSLLYQDAAEENGIRVRHFSIREFLVGSTCPPKFRVDQKLANCELTRCCLVTMAKELQFNICGLETACLSNADIPDLNDRVRRRIPDTLQYSCMHWASHLCYDADPASAELAGLLDNFFAESQTLYWIEVLSLMGKVPAAISSVRLIKGCFKKFEDRHQHLVEDALRFLSAFFTPISTSTPHLYVSALPFMPVESDLWKHACISFPEIIDVCKGRMESWPVSSSIWRGHTGQISCIAYSPDGLTVVSGSSDKTIRIWDAQTGAPVGQPLTGHTGAVFSVAYSPDGRNVVSGCEDETIRIWDAQTGAPVGQPLTGHTDFVWSVAYSPDGRNVVSGSDDRTIRIWDAQTGVPVGQPLAGHTEAVFSVAYSPDGGNVVSSSSDNTIRIWDAQTGAPVGQPLTGHTDWVWSIAYSPDGRNVVSGSDDKTIRIWDAQTGAPVGKPLTGHTGAVQSVAYSPDARNVVSGSDDKTIRIWDAQTGAPVGQPLTGHTGLVLSVAYSPDGQNVVSGSLDKTIRIWDAQTGAPVGQPLTGHTGTVWSVACSPDGRNIVSGSDDETIRIWDAQTGAPVGQPLTGHTGLVLSVAYSPDGQNVVSGSDDKTIRIWDAQTGAPVGQPLTGHTGTVWSVACSPDGRNIVSGSDDETIRIWDAQTGAPVGKPLTGHTGRVYSVAYSPDGQNVISGSQDETIRIWDVQTGAPVGKPLSGHTGTVWSVAYSPDGRNVVSGSDDKTIRIWDAQTGAPVGQPLTGHTETVFSVAYSPDGLTVVSGSEDGTIRIWDAQTGAPVGQPLTGHTDWVWSVAYSPDGRNVVSGSDDKTIRIWDAQIGMDEAGHRMVSRTGHPSNNHLSLIAFSGRPIPSTRIDPDGWVRGAEGLLFWVPEDCRHGLTCPAIMTIPHTGRNRTVRIDFTHFHYGDSWTNIRGGVQEGSRGRSLSL